MNRARRDPRIGRARGFTAVVLIGLVGSLISAGLAGGSQPFDTYQVVVGTDSPAAQYRFSDAFGSTTLADSAGSDTATNSGVVLSNAGPFGGSKSGSFGGSAFASLGSNPLAGATAFTAEAWIDQTGGTFNEESIFAFGSSSSNFMYLTPGATASPHKMTFEIHTPTGSAQLAVAKLKSASWQYVAVTETSSGTIKLYVNGINEAEITGQSLHPSSLGTTTGNYLGKSPVTADPPFNGLLSNVAFYTTALSQSRIEAHYHAGVFPVNTVVPTITGTTKDGNTLNAKAGTWAGLAPITFTYQWLRCNSAGSECKNSGSATSTAEYALSPEDVGRTMRVAVAGTNSATSEPEIPTQTATSAQTTEVEALKPGNLTLPVIAGAAQDEAVLTASKGTWEGTPPLEFSYQWSSCNSAGASCKKITGATSSSYTIPTAEIGKTIRVGVTATNGAGSKAVNSAVTAVITAAPPVSREAPKLTGAQEVGGVLTTGTGAWSGTAPITYAYAWQRCHGAGVGCAEIADAKTSSHTISSEDVGVTVRAIVTATNSAGSATAASEETSVLTASAPSIVTAPQITGVAQEGRWLSASEGKWSGSPYKTFSYQWEDCDVLSAACTAIAGATNADYLPGPLDIGYALRVDVTATATDQTSTTSESAETEAVAPGPYFVTEFGRENESEGDLGWPIDVALDPSGRLWVLDRVNDRFARLDESGHPDTAWFGGAGSANGKLKSPDALTIDSEGHVWVADTGNNRVEEFSAEGAFIRKLTTTTSESFLSRPAGVALDAAGNVWVSDTGKHRMDEFSGSGEYLSAIEGILGEPTNVAFDPTGRLWVIDDTNEYVDELSTSGTLLTHFGTFGSSDGKLEEPSGLAVDGEGDLWIGDTGNNRVEEFNGSGEYLGQFGAKGSDPGELRGPTGLRVAASGEIRVVDADEGRIQLWHKPSIAPASEVAPSVDGEAVEGQVLRADPGHWSGTPLRFAYQWQHCDEAGEGCEDIPSARSESYVPLSADVGATLRVSVRAVNASGSSSASSPVTAVVTTPTAPSNTEAPVVSGTPEDGAQLHVSNGAWSGTPPTYAYQWERCNALGGACKELEDASGPKYQLGDADIGSTLRAIVTATNAAGSTNATSATSPPIEAEATTELEAPAVSGVPDAGSLLRASHGSWTGTQRHFLYQWERCESEGAGCVPIDGATDWEYALGGVDEGGSVRVRIGLEGTTGALTDVSAATPAVGAAGALASSAAPSVDGPAQRGQMLTASQGAWAGSSADSASFTYRWQRCDQFGAACHDIAEADEAGYAPTEEDLGSALRVAVTASVEEQTSTRVSSATQPVANEGAPIVQQAPQVRGMALEGHALTVTTGAWGETPPSSYSYQWERCTSASCEAIIGQTEASYSPAEADVGFTLRALVSAVGAGGTSTALSSPTAVIDPGALSSHSPPSIVGRVQLGGTLAAEPGVWSGDGPVSYGYQWESCNASGESCVPDAEATNAEYELTSGDLGSTLRVAVTATGPHGSETKRSTLTLTVPTGEVTAEEAELLAEGADPAIFAHSTIVLLEGQTIAPGLSDGDEILPQQTLTSSAVSKEAPGEFSVNTPDGELSVVPVETSPEASHTPTLINGSAALFADTFPGTDTIIRPNALGASTILQLRSPQSPKSYSWEIGLGADQRLQQLSNGSVAVIDAPEASEETHGTSEPEAHEAGEGAPETPEEATQLEHEEAEAEVEPVLESPSVASEISTLPAAPSPGLLQPQDTEAQYEHDSSSFASAEAETAGLVLMVLSPPVVQDAEGATVPASLSVHGNEVTMTVRPSGMLAYPLLADVSVGAPTDQQSSERDPFEYGLSDEEPSHFGTGLDERLKTGPLGIKTARLFIPYDVLVPAEELKEKAANAGKEPERERLEQWLAVTHANGLAAYIVVQHSNFGGKSISEYRAGVKLLMSKYKGMVSYWGAWNEPDLSRNLVPAGRAADFWQTAEATALETGCHCTVVAGEFSKYSLEESKIKAYTAKYREALNTYCASCWRKKHKLWQKHSRPGIIGLHDYEDVVNYGFHSRFLHQFEGYARGAKFGKPRIWIGEAGVQLANGQSRTSLAASSESARFQVQTAAADEFLNLRSGLAVGERVSRVERVFYYHYQAPSEARVAEVEAEGKQEFDSGLLEAKPENKGKSLGDVRPAYCVIAYSSHECPPDVVSTEPTLVSVGPKAEEAEAVAFVNPHGLPAEVEAVVEGAGGETPHVVKIGAGVIHPIRENINVGHVGGCLVYSYHVTVKTTGGTATGQSFNGGVPCS